MRCLLFSLLLLFLVAASLSAEAPADSQRTAEDTLQVVTEESVQIDSMWVIPAGPLAGSFTPESRLQVIDTVAGWAKVSVEGWVPIGRVLDRIESVNTNNTSTSVKSNNAAPRTRCAAITQKGTRCKRMAEPGKTTCWQHSK